MQMSLAKTFWSPRFGMVAGRFGVRWMVSVRLKFLPETEMKYLLLFISKSKKALRVTGKNDAPACATIRPLSI
jgi:hypothetical protein